MTTAQQDLSGISTILFDIGGVLVRLQGTPFKQKWLTGSNHGKDVLPFWHHSQAVRNFEIGRIGKHDFARSFIAENSLDVTSEEFLEHLLYWPNRLFDGVPQMLAQLGERFRLAALSNSNELHWPRLMQEMKLAEMIPQAVSSHQINAMKPSKQAFERAIGQLDLVPGETLFLDDLQASVDSASALGLTAVKVVGTRGGVETARCLGLV